MIGGRARLTRASRSPGRPRLLRWPAAVPSVAPISALVPLAPLALLIAATILPRAALAQATADDQTITVVGDAPPPPPRNFGNFRAGAGSASETGHAYVCLEVSPLSFLSIEGCGTGSGFLHEDDASETAHFRSKLRFASFPWRGGFLQPHVGLGFAELQIAEDTSGFDFGGTGPDGVETAGPEAGLGIRLLYPLSRTLELVGDAGVSYAWMPHAPDLVEPHSTHQVTASFTLGVGF